MNEKYAVTHSLGLATFVVSVLYLFALALDKNALNDVIKLEEKLQHEIPKDIQEDTASSVF